MGTKHIGATATKTSLQPQCITAKTGLTAGLLAQVSNTEYLRVREKVGSVSTNLRCPARVHVQPAVHSHVLTCLLDLHARAVRFAP